MYGLMAHFFIFLASSAFSQHAGSGQIVQGQEITSKTKALATGSRIIQRKAPFAEMNIYVVGFHPMKNNPSQQMEAHHFCRQVNEDFAQCALFDGNTKEAKLNGIEYIISEKIFETLPAEEKKYWHPHNYEILSGQLVAPGLPKLAEKEFLKQKMNSYGKTWHVWDTGHQGMPGNSLPVGEPMLAWSFNKDGEAIPELISNMEKKMNIDTNKKRFERQDLVKFAKPQEGVDVLAGKFNRETKAIPGVQRK
ncbi:OBAP family protein [Bdellovibrio bacteriovorus]